MTAPILVTGGAGFLGRSVVGMLVAAGHRAVAPSSRELDVRDGHAVSDVTAGVAPAAIIHLAYRVNERDTIVDGSANVAVAAARTGARLVHLSTDVVFAGRSDPYTEDDIPDPVHPYGAAKAEAEEAVSLRAPDAVIVRTSLLYRADRVDGGEPVHAVQRALQDPETFRFFTDEVRCPAVVDDVAAGVVALATKAALAGVRGPLHLAGPEALSRAVFARAVADWLGGDPEVLRSTTQASLGLTRPGHVVLDTSRATSLALPTPRSVTTALSR